MDVDRGQVRVTVHRMNLRLKLNLNVRFPSKLFYQVAGHAFLQGFAPYDRRHRARIVGEVQGRLPRRIPRTNKVDAESVRGTRFATRRSVVDTLANHPIEALNRDAAP